jgi:secreted trypsin-like serine protease
MVRNAVAICAVAAACSAATTASAIAGQTGRELKARATRLGASPTPDMIGGSDVSEGSFPWLAFITGTSSDGQGFLCSGSVISTNLILTAGHCAFDIDTGTVDPAGSYRVITGTSDWSTALTSQISTVSQTFLAPGYTPSTGRLDAATFELSTPTTVPALALATPAETWFLVAGDDLAMAGWGLTDASDPDSVPEELQWAPTVVQRTTYCANTAAQARAPFDSSSEFCAIDAPYDDDRSATAIAAGR